MCQSELLLENCNILLKSVDEEFVMCTNIDTTYLENCVTVSKTIGDFSSLGYGYYILT